MLFARRIIWILFILFEFEWNYFCDIFLNNDNNNDNFEGSNIPMSPSLSLANMEVFPHDDSVPANNTLDDSCDFKTGPTGSWGDFPIFRTKWQVELQEIIQPRKVPRNRIIRLSGLSV